MSTSRRNLLLAFIAAGAAFAAAPRALVAASPLTAASPLSPAPPTLSPTPLAPSSTPLARAATGVRTAADSTSPLGLWKTIDDKTGKPRVLVRIYTQNGELFGRLEKSFTPGAETRRCEKCSDERKNQPIIGLLIIRHMRFEDGQYRGGDILDPESGSVYSCRLSVKNGGNTLEVRGYLGIALLGRTQIWQREPTPDGAG